MSASIVIPVFNRAHLVRRAIETALSQTIPCEVIVVDHGSTDAIDDAITPYGDQIRYVRREEDSGPVASWIDGVNHASGEYIHFTFDDDWIAPTFIERSLEAFDEDVAFVYCRALIHWEGTRRQQLTLRHPAGKQPVDRIVRYLLRSPLTISPGCAVFRTRDARRNLLQEVPGASGRFGPGTGVGEDLLLFLLTTMTYESYVHVPLALASFRAHGESITINALESGGSTDLVRGYDAARDYFRSVRGQQEEKRILVAADLLRWWIGGRIARGGPRRETNCA